MSHDFDDDLPEGRPEVMRRFFDPQFHDELKKADLILCKDERSGDEFLVFGRSTLKRIVGSGSGQPMDCAVLRVVILRHTKELEALLAAVQVVKGYHEYEGRDQTRN